jgi:DNA polymerase elongation subunit (family B)
MSLEQVSVIVHAYDISVEQEVVDPTDGLVKTNIHLWTLDRNSNPYLIRIDNYQMSCNVILPELVGGYSFEWTQTSIDNFLSFVANKLGDKRPTSYEFHKSSVIYYDHGDKKFPMIKFSFNTINHMFECSKLLSRPLTIYKISPMPIQFTVCETNIDIVRKMMTERDCQYSQWFQIEGISIPPEETEYRIQHPGPPDRPLGEIVAKYESLTPIPNEVSSAWSTKPRIVAFDIESYSNNHKAMPNEYNPLHCVNIITCVCQVKGESSTRQKYAFVLGDCPDITDAVIISVPHEDELLECMASLVRDYCPEIIIGYNIIGFDYRYLDTRLKNKMKEWPQMGRIKKKLPTMLIMDWKSSAYGRNKLSILQADGIISIDMYPLIKRDYKLDKYDLDFVSKHFIGRGKHEVKFVDMFKSYEKSMFAREIIEKVVGEINQDDPELFEEIAKSKIETYADAVKARLDLMERGLSNGKLTEHHRERVRKAIKRFGMARDEMKKFVAYGLEDATLCIDLFDKLNIWEGLIQLSNVVGVTIMQLFTRGQQIRFLSQVYHMANKMGYVINKRIANKLFFNGGFVFEPVRGLHDNIICLDFASLYPSIMMAYNICLSTLVPPERMSLVTDKYAETIEFNQEEPRDGKPKKRSGDADMNDFFDDDDDPVVEGEEGEEKPDDIVTRSYCFKWVKKSVREGILPRCERELTDGRKGVKNQIKVIEQRSEACQDAAKHIAKYNNDGKTTEELIDYIKTTIATLEDKWSSMADGKDKNVVKIEIEDFQDILTVLEGYRGKILNDVMNENNKLIKDYKLQLVVLDKRQNAMKVSANSMFGALGAQNGGVLPLIEGAMSITATGRRLITQVNDYLKEKYGARIVYNDTDSVFVDLGIVDSREAFQRGIDLSIEISGKDAKLDKEGNIISPAIKGLFPPPLKMEFEKAMRVLCLKKKKYAALLINRDGSFQRDKKSGDLYILQRGIVLQRRDTCKYLFKIYRELLTNVLEKKPVEVGYQIIIKAITDLIQGKVPARGNLTVIRELGSAYKSDSFCMKVFAEHLQRLGRPPNPGDRLEYVIVRTTEDDEGKNVKLGQKMRDFAMYEEANRGDKDSTVAVSGESVYIFEDEDDPMKNTETVISSYAVEPIDYMYYMDHLLKNALDQLFSTSYESDLVKLKHIVYTPYFNKRMKKVSPVCEPIEMISRMWKDYAYGGYTLDQFAEMVPGLVNWFNEQMTLVK